MGQMKAKLLIGPDDFVVNPNKYFVKKIPKFYPTDTMEYSTERGHFNYGVFRSVEYANAKAAPLLNAVVSYVYGETQDDRDAALEILQKLAEDYKP